MKIKMKLLEGMVFMFKNNKTNEKSMINFFLICLIVITISTVLISMIPVTSAADIFVNGSASDDTGGGTDIELDPYLYIGQAINETNNDVSGDGPHNIIIAGGNYNGLNLNTNLTLNQSVNIYGAKYYYNFYYDGAGEEMEDTIIDGENLYQILNMGDLTITLNIYGIIFQNGYKVGDSGGAISRENETAFGNILNIYNCTFENNKAGKEGGALHIHNTNVTIENSTFINNSASLGGAIYFFESDELIIRFCNFTSNSVGGTAQGGAINQDKGTLTIENSLFDSNECFTGGALFLDNVDCIISYSNFTNNGIVDDSWGGAIYLVNNGTLKIDNSKFDSNKGEYGASIYLINSNLAIDSSEFTNNFVDFAGGAIYQEIVSNEKFYLNISNSTFYNNTGNIGGAIYLDNVNVSIDNNSNFTNNSVNGPNALGGAIYQNDGKLIIDSTYFEENSAIGSAGAIYLNGSAYLNISNSSFISNNATGNGGAIVKNSFADLNISNVTFQDNSASDGGALYVNNVGMYIIYIDISNFISNKASNSGGAIYQYGNDLNILNSNFTSNSANAGSGGALFYNLGDDLLINFAIFENNNASINGGAVSVDGVSNVNMDTCNFTNNNVKANVGSGGAISLSRVDGSHNYLDNILFDNNHAIFNGGALQLVESEVLFIRFSNFTNNSVTGTNGVGGAIYSFNSALHTIICIFENNSAFKSGGAIGINRGFLSTSMSDFINNTVVSTSGGAIYVISSDRFIFITQCNFINNSIRGLNGSGGAIFLQNSGLEISLILFENNFATNSGGAIKVIETPDSPDISITISDSEFIGNTAYSSSSIGTGGAISQSGGDLYLSFVTFDNNAANNGGAIHLDFMCEAVIDGNCIFTDNVATSRGGVIYSSMAFITIKNIIFSHNTGYDGGVIYSSQTTLSVSQSNFVQNNAVRGGAIYNYMSTIQLTGSTFNSNEATSFGGAIYSMGGVPYPNEDCFNITSCKFTENSAGSYGGAIANLDSNEFNIINSNFDSNFVNNGAGGAIFNSGGLTVRGTVFYNNAARIGNGGAFANNGTLKMVTILNSNFDHNSANTGSGGAIYNIADSKDIFLISNTNFGFNDAKSEGGAIANLRGTISIANSKIFNNEALGAFGGAISNRGTLILNTTNVNNNAVNNGNGGAIANLNSGRLVIDKSSFSNNNGIFGGVIFSNSTNPNSQIFNSLFTLNVATQSGGVIYHRGSGNLSISGSSFNRNLAFNDGGAIYNVGIISVKNSVFNGDNSKKSQEIANYGSRSEFISNRITSTLYGIFNNANSVTIQKNTIISKEFGIYNIGNNNKISNNIINCNYGNYGIYSVGNQNSLVSNDIKAVTIGIYKIGDNNLISSNLISNSFALSKHGIFVNGKNNNISSNKLRFKTNNVLNVVGSGNYLSKNSIRSSKTAINIQGNRNKLLSNKISTKGSQYFINITGNKNKISNHKFNGNKKIIGISINKGSKNNLIRGNDFNKFSNGVYDLGYRTVIHKNSFAKNKYALNIHNSSKFSTIKYNKFDKNYCGIYKKSISMKSAGNTFSNHSYAAVISKFKKKSKSSDNKNTKVGNTYTKNKVNIRYV